MRAGTRRDNHIFLGQMYRNPQVADNGKVMNISVEAVGFFHQHRLTG
ncbi:MAG: hypothetical protein WCP20_15780 [Desulfuromonadales bacterium]